MGRLAAPVAKPSSETAVAPAPTSEGARPAVSGATPMVGVDTYRYGPSSLGLPDDVQPRMRHEGTAPADRSADGKAGVSPSPAPPPSPPAAPNRTGLPDPLKHGVERLAGVDLSRVRVHYRSAEPARFDALAYAFGSEIHLAPGQEHHLPHETWHLAQQAQGRVAPTVQWKREVPGNEDAALEREADRMGEAALRPITAADSPPTRARLPTAARGVLQRTPQQALDRLAPSPTKESLARMLATATRIVETFPLVGSRTDTYRTIKAQLAGEVRRIDRIVASEGVDFIGIWNRGLGKSAFARIPASASTYQPPTLRPSAFADPSNVDSYLARWLHRPLAEKSSSPDRKLAKAIPLLLSEAPFPEHVATALKLYFAHTANFVPVDNVGRDFQAKAHGQYYRSSNEPVRKGNTKVLKKFTRGHAARANSRFPAKFTAQVTNHPQHLALRRHGALKKQIAATEFIAPPGYGDSRIAVYQSVAGTHTGSLGQIQNVYRTLQVGAHTLMPPPVPIAPVAASAAASSSASAVPQRDPGLQPLIDTERLAPGTADNYHDRLLADRGALVAGVAGQIAGLYPGGGAGWKIVPIQSPTHASLILELVDPAGGPILSEREWRELFIPTFNTVARTLGVQTRATHRGSFGFLYPTVSSVGGPVRIWPGLTPPDLFRQLVLGTLARLAATDARFRAPATQGLPAPRDQASWASSSPDVPLYREALKTAVRYAQDTMQDIATLDGPRQFVQWILLRLRHNLLRADFLLGLEPPDTPAERETDYLKSASVIENLMEYSYLLESFNTQVPAKPQDTPDDPYPAYLRGKLALDGRTHATATYYLDSGMQAIVTANLLVRAWNSQRHPPSAAAPLESIDLNSYFEYAAVDKENLKVLPINRDATGFQGPDALGATLRAREQRRAPAPHIIAADLNPVLTSREGRASLVLPAEVLQYFAQYHHAGGKTVNQHTVPIVDVTNASLATAAALKLQEGYENFIVVESLSKHQQLGADKFTMGRLNVVGSAAFLACAKALIEPIEAAAFHRLPATYRLRMDRIFYGGGGAATSQAPAPRYRPRPPVPVVHGAGPAATRPVAPRVKRRATHDPSPDGNLPVTGQPAGAASQSGPAAPTTAKRARGADDTSPRSPIASTSRPIRPPSRSSPPPTFAPSPPAAFTASASSRPSPRLPAGNGIPSASFIPTNAASTSQPARGLPRLPVAYHLPLPTSSGAAPAATLNLPLGYPYPSSSPITPSALFLQMTQGAPAYTSPSAPYGQPRQSPLPSSSSGNAYVPSASPPVYRTSALGAPPPSATSSRPPSHLPQAVPPAPVHIAPLRPAIDPRNPYAALYSQPVAPSSSHAPAPTIVPQPVYAAPTYTASQPATPARNTTQPLPSLFDFSRYGSLPPPVPTIAPRPVYTAPTYTTSQPATPVWNTTLPLPPLFDFSQYGGLPSSTTTDDLDDL
ncbi:DUF4157 domain-containing protein [Burkholderia gladioli]|uniref:eCIS core domain-containing protein n=1 Tax=Burkholderia gladioli TaxID=28095 RepID=UPI001C21A4E9|nr:DUF4157 domain-containing protein [Burkholderia gladioli]MBU9213173.1 DUF4157 domain-containing protein [Burkholderia gladioli]MDN7722408.1 DUF4157 domain-containing protein [Burkholderia gladioli]